MLEINGKDLTVSDVIAVARKGQNVSLDSEARRRVLQVHGWVKKIVESNQPVYGINTGFGALSDKQISKEEIKKLNRNLIISHAMGVGEYLPGEVVRAAMLIRANTLAKGHSGVRPQVIEKLLALLNNDITPLIPSQGSLGSSGDLAQLCHLALVFTAGDEDEPIQEVWVEHDGQRMTNVEALRMAGIEPIQLVAKEGLAISNGATFSAALSCLAVHDAFVLLKSANLALAMTLEALMGSSASFDLRIQQLRTHPGQQWVAQEIERLTKGSTLLDNSAHVQDAYSLRCAPQIHGAVYDSYVHIKNVVASEINAATDNPLLFSPGVALSGGNFHGEPLGFVMDYLAISFAEIASVSERRTFRLMNDKLNDGLPSMLADTDESAGLNSGLMMAQYTAASLVLENRTLANSDSVHSLTTSADQEDHNANSMTAARHAYQLLSNVRRVLAIELYSAAQALDLRLRARPDVKPGKLVAKAHQQIRDVAPYSPKDIQWRNEIEKVHQLLRQELLV